MQIDRKLVKKYFNGIPLWTIILIVVGLLTMLGGTAGSIIFGLLMAGGGGAMLYLTLKNLPTDEQIDTWLAQDFQRLTDRALEKLGIDKSETIREPAIIPGIRFWDTGGAKLMYRKGKDKQIRFTPIDLSIISFGQNQLMAYNCVFDFLTGNPLNESTDEYFYRDVVSVSTKTASKSYKAKVGKKVIQLDHSESFALTTKGGTSIEIILGDEKLAGELKGTISKTSAEAAIQSIRTMLRDKKS